MNEIKGIINKGELGEIRRRDISENENLNTQLETRWPGSEVFLRVHCSLTLPNNPVPHGGTIHAYNKTACRLREEKRIGRGKSISATGSMSCDRFHVSFFPFNRSKPLGRRPLCNQTARIIEAGQRQNRGSDPYLWAFESMELDKSVFFTLSRLLPLPLSTAVLFNSSVILLRVPTILCPIPIPVIPVFLPFFFFSNRMRIFPAPTKFYIEWLISPFSVRWLQFLFCDNFIGI